MLAAALALLWLIALQAPAVSMPGTRAYSGAQTLILSVSQAPRRVARGGPEALHALLALAGAVANLTVLAALWRGFSRPRRPVASVWRWLAGICALAALCCGALALTLPLALRWGYVVWMVCLCGATASLWWPRTRGRRGAATP